MGSLLRRAARRGAVLPVLAGALAILPAVAIAAVPETITFSYFDCEGPAGTPETFEAVKLATGSSGLHVVGSTSIWFLVHVESVATGQVFVTMPPQALAAFADSTVTCLINSPVRGELLIVTGVFHPGT